MKFIIQIIFLTFFAQFIIAQSDERDYDEELKYQNDAINALKTEINQLRLKIKTAESRERSASTRISSLDEEISLTAKLIRSLKSEEEKTRKRILQLKSEILKNENELESLRARYKKRVVNSYKKGRLTDLEKVFSSTTWRQAIYRTQYLKIISDIEKKLTNQIERLLIQISQQKLELEAVLRNNLKLVRDKQQQISSYRDMRIDREKELNRIRNDKKALSNYIEEKADCIIQLESIIKKLLEPNPHFPDAWFDSPEVIQSFCYWGGCSQGGAGHGYAPAVKRNYKNKVKPKFNINTNQLSGRAAACLKKP